MSGGMKGSIWRRTNAAGLVFPRADGRKLTRVCLVVPDEPLGQKPDDQR